MCDAQVTPTLALYDTMQYVRSPTATVCYGMCLGMGGFLLTAGGEKVGGGQHTDSRVFICRPESVASGSMVALPCALRPDLHCIVQLLPTMSDN